MASMRNEWMCDAIGRVDRSAINHVERCCECGEGTPARLPAGDLLWLRLKLVSPRGAKVIPAVILIHERCLLAKIGRAA